jgi:endonuclease YncB( thermonuclease family)
LCQNEYEWLTSKNKTVGFILNSIDSVHHVGQFINVLVIRWRLDETVLLRDSLISEPALQRPGDKAVDVAARVKLKSDRRARALIMALCILPVATPLLAAGVNVFLATGGATSAAPSVPAATVARPPLRASFDSPVFSPEPMGAQVPMEPQPVQGLLTAAPDPSTSPAVVRAGGPRVLRDVAILEGLQIRSEGLVVTLAGIEPAPQGSECRRLDGVVEACAKRAANRLDILTRGRPVVCALREGDAGAMRGVCRAGKIDLADDLVRNGLAVRTSNSL